jgi:hypothetical protein
MSSEAIFIIILKKKMTTDDQGFGVGQQLAVIHNENAE